MTRERSRDHINLDATVRHALDESQRLLRERVLRELRYKPHFSGDVTVTLRLRNGIPYAAVDRAENHVLIEPVS